MKNKFLKFQQNYYRNINHMMNKLNLEIDEKYDDNEEEYIEENNKKKEIKKCQICNEKEFKYICPKCKIFYCSIDCYKNHNKNCTEEFYKNNVIEELKSTKVNEEEGKKFRYILKSYYDNINKSIGEFNLDNNELENKKIERYENFIKKMENGTFNEEQDFTPEDWNDFKKFLNSANEEKFGKLYKPFWLRTPCSLDIIDLNEINKYNDSDKQTLLNLNLNLFKEYFNDHIDNNNEEEEEIEDLNIIKLNGQEIEINEEIINKSIIIKYENIKLLKNLTSINPNSKNIYQLIIIVCTIIYIFRLFNGDFERYNEEDIDILEYIFYISPLLYNKNEIIEDSLEENLTKFFNKIEKIEKDFVKNTKYLIYRDLKCILIGYKFFIFEGLIRLYDIIHYYSLKLCLNKEQKIKCSNSKFKLLYFMSFLKSNISNEAIDQILNKIKEINY